MSEIADHAFTVEAPRVGLASPKKDPCRGEKVDGHQRWGERNMGGERGLGRSRAGAACAGCHGRGRREPEGGGSLLE